MLKEMFDKQVALQQKLGNTDIVGNQEYINIMSLALLDEVHESLRETPWKPWKKQQSFNQDNYKKELIDAWHFMINLTLASGMNAEELYEAFCKKNKENVIRKETGY